MSGWEQKIIDAFISHYTEDQQTLRLRSSVFFPDFDTIHPDEKESYLEAAESLERKGIIKLRWEKRDKGERLKTLSCDNIEKLFAEAGRKEPNVEAERIRAMLAAQVQVLQENASAAGAEIPPAAKIFCALLRNLSVHFSPRHVGHGIDQHIVKEFVRFLEFSQEPFRMEKITTRALSIVLYNDSKRLENILHICKPLISGLQKLMPCTSLVFPERVYPETAISGKLAFEYKIPCPPLVNAKGIIVGLPLESVEEIKSIQTLFAKEEKTVLTIENKETFYALGSPHKYGANENVSRYDCFLYTGGYPNHAAAALIHILSVSGFSFYHAGDLDPDGVLILQHIRDIAQKPVVPLRMDAATFDQYQSWARPLTQPMIRQMAKISEETKSIPGIVELLQRIEEKGLGVEQEIIDYR